MKNYSLVGVDGNAFSVMSYIRNVMKKENKSVEEIKAYSKKAMSGDYNNLLMVSQTVIDKLNKGGIK